MDTFDTQYFKVNRLLLTFCGLWPFQPPRSGSILLYWAILGALIIFLPQIAYIFKYARCLDDLYDVLPSLIGSCICLTKVLGLHCKFKEFQLLIQHVHNDWCHLAGHEDIRILLEYMEPSRVFTLAYSIFVSTFAASYITAPITVPIFDIILASNVTRPKRLPHPSEFFVDQEKYYYYLLMITYLGYASCVMIAIATDTVYFALLQHTCGMLAILSHRLENLVICNRSKCTINHNLVYTSDKDVGHLTQCIQLQIRIERLVQLVESTFSICLCAEIGLGMLFQCSSCVMIVTHTEMMEIMRNGPLLIIQISRIFFNSWIGQRIIDHSSRIPEAAYNGLWYRSSMAMRRMLLLLILRCQKPYRITTAKLYVISLEGYSTVR
ncbi:uncharacterized protein LOC116851305 [Odontomachus brunneus]|uniref:uncharacterized protein LOC116851305 n=1 Tax=Odontomachus brunneus TaxID=486640 RepID=UPI0013F1D965|nr:uncharacterized protein LOC116851305 [Odontomachus brunneus]